MTPNPMVKLRCIKSMNVFHELINWLKDVACDMHVAIFLVILTPH